MVHKIQFLYSTKPREMCTNFDAYCVHMFQIYAADSTTFINATHSFRVDRVIRLVLINFPSHAEALEFISW